MRKLIASSMNAGQENRIGALPTRAGVTLADGRRSGTPSCVYWFAAAPDTEPKPVPAARPPRVANRLRFTRVENLRGAPQSSLPSAVASASRPGSPIILRVKGRVIVVNEADIDWIDGAGNYVKFHVGREKHLVRGTLRDVEATLPPPFVRAHRSTIINIAAVQEFVRTPFGDLIALLFAGDRLAVGRTYRSNVEAAFATRL